MTNDAILVLECLFESVWLLFTSWYIPGTDVTPAGAFMFLAFAGLALRFLYRLVGLAPMVDVSATARDGKFVMRHVPAVERDH